MPFSPQPTCDVTIDVSHHQGQIDWAAMKDTGIQCVMIKATQGLGKDSRWEINRDGARQQGLLIIPYIFLTSAVGPVEQAGFFIQTAGLAAGMPAALDWEGDDAPGADVVERIGLAVAEMIKRDPLGYWGISPPDTPTALMKPWPRWIPRYGVNDGNPDMNHRPTEPWLFWQYTSNQEIDGISGTVDASLFAGSEAELKAWCQTGALPASLAGAIV
jgi:GH25 family lysozyme M1 (1,4-beta-N-acetylmuramidase)